MRVIVGTILAVFVLAFGALPASAGGPTSVLLTSPGTEQAAALYNGDPAYVRLDRIVQGGEAVPRREVHSGQAGYVSERVINITWLAHDVHVWRINRIYLDARGGPQIETSFPEGDEHGIGSASSVRRIAEPKKLPSLLNDLGLLDAATADRMAARTRPAVDRAATRQVTGAGGDEQWVWAIGGLAAGVVLAGALGGLRRRRQPR